MALKTIVSLALLFFLPCISYSQKRDTTITSKLYLMMEEKKYDSALVMVDKVIASYPSWADLYNIRGDLHLILQNSLEALADYTKAIKYSNGDPIYIQQRANVFYSMQMAEEAIRDNDMALSLVKNNDTLRQGLLVNRGNAKAMKRDYQGAYEDYSAALRFDSTYIGALIGLGAVLDDLGREDEAIAYLEKGIQINPKEAGAIGNLGYRYMMKGNYRKALELFNKVLELEPQKGIAYNNRGFTKYRLGDYRGAFADVQKSLRIYPQNSYALKNRALIYIATGYTSKACEDLDMALKYGFTQMYGDEVLKLKEAHCINGKL